MMTQQTPFKMMRLSPWQFWLMGAVGFSLAIAIVVIAATFLLVLAPMALAAGVYYRLRGYGRKPQETETIDVDYAVVDDKPGNGVKPVAGPKG
ncbi:MAG: hypothetical protein SGJ17_07925 [Hyphomicrobiales bacterium]|nr:hypothetical protein [Hyphomicrobiales bacterium]